MLYVELRAGPIRRASRYLLEAVEGCKPYTVYNKPRLAIDHGPETRRFSIFYWAVLAALHPQITTHCNCLEYMEIRDRQERAIAYGASNSPILGRIWGRAALRGQVKSRGQMRGEQGPLAA